MTGSDRYCPVCGRDTAEPYCPDDGTATVVRAPPGEAKTSFEVGDLIEGRYRIVGVLGKGGFGAVYDAEHTGTGQLVAVKVMLADLSEHNIQSVRRFYKEAQVTAQLRHPNTVRVFDVGQASGGALYIAMERLHGPTLEAALRDLGAQGTAMTERQALDIAIPVLRSLAEAHSMELVHRDLKPANIMLSEVADDEPVVKVLDFGIARTQDSSLTGQGTALGTPAYMSPEQCMGGQIDGRSDLYALGVILFRCVTGRTPFDDPNPLTVMYKHAHAPVPDPREHAKSALSPGFLACVAQALEKRPDARFDSARAMRLTLEAVRDGVWSAGLASGDLDQRERSAAARRRSAERAGRGALGETLPYSPGDEEPEEASEPGVAASAAPADRRTEQYQPETEPPQLALPGSEEAEAGALDRGTGRSGLTAEVSRTAHAEPASDGPASDGYQALPSPGAGRKRAFWAGLGLLVVAVLAVGAWSMRRDKPGADRPAAAAAPADATPARTAPDAGGSADPGAAGVDQPDALSGAASDTAAARQPVLDAGPSTASDVQRAGADAANHTQAPEPADAQVRASPPRAHRPGRPRPPRARPDAAVTAPVAAPPAPRDPPPKPDPPKPDPPKPDPPKVEKPIVLD